MDPALLDTIAHAVRRLQDTLLTSSPGLAQPTIDWMVALAGGRSPENYFSHPLAFPTLLLPWWAAQACPAGETDVALQQEIAYSSINGYYFIRMIDNVMDGDASVDPRLLPALALFHTEFQSVYQRLFDPTHGFWVTFREAWLGSADAAVQDARMKHIPLDQFELASARKVRAALIPVAAVCHRLGCGDRIAAWSELVFRLGRWHQMQNDLFDWFKDSTHGNQTYFLSLADQQRAPGQTTAEWVAQVGFTQACDTLRQWMQDAQAAAITLNSAPLLDDLQARSANFERRARDAQAGLAALRGLAEALK